MCLTEAAALAKPGTVLSGPPGPGGGGRLGGQRPGSLRPGIPAAPPVPGDMPGQGHPRVPLSFPDGKGCEAAAVPLASALSSSLAAGPTGRNRELGASLGSASPWRPRPAGPPLRGGRRRGWGTGPGPGPHGLRPRRQARRPGSPSKRAEGRPRGPGPGGSRAEGGVKIPSLMSDRGSRPPCPCPTAQVTPGERQEQERKKAQPVAGSSQRHTPAGSEAGPWTPMTARRRALAPTCDLEPRLAGTQPGALTSLLTSRPARSTRSGGQMLPGLGPRGSRVPVLQAPRAPR